MTTAKFVPPPTDEQIMVQQGYKVQQILQMEGWEIISNALNLIKIKAEQDRKKANRLQSTRENIFYWNGVVDGVNDTMDEIYNIVKTAKDIEAQGKNLSQREDI